MLTEYDFKPREALYIKTAALIMDPADSCQSLADWMQMMMGDACHSNCVANLCFKSGWWRQIMDLDCVN